LTIEDHREHRGVEELPEFDPGDEVLGPADVGLEAFEAGEFDPDDLVELNPVDEVDRAALWGEVADRYAVFHAARPAQLDLCAEWLALGAAFDRFGFSGHFCSAAWRKLGLA
jgi:hypothetical protein